MPDVEGIGVKHAYADVGASFTAATTGWTVVAGLTDIETAEEEVDDIETTDHDVTDKHRTYQPGLVEPGEIEVTCNYDKTIFAAMGALRGVTKKYRYLFSDGSGQGWTGYLKKRSTSVDIEGVNTMSFTYKVSGPITDIAATS